MATIESMAIRANAALDEIEGAFKTFGYPMEEVRRMHADRAMLHVIQIEAIARHLSSMAGSASMREAVQAKAEDIEAQNAVETAPDNSKDVQAMFDASLEKQAAPIKGKPKK